jgi:hypothetical protein
VENPEEMNGIEPIDTPAMSVRRSEKIGTLVASLAKAQADFEAVLKTSDNPFYGSSYADLAAVLASSRPHLSKNGIAMMHFPQSDLARQVAIMTVGIYKDEQFIEVTSEAPAAGRAKKDNDNPTAPATKFDVQTLGACWTYLRRYLTQGLLALASEDDDGNSVSGSQPARTTPAQATAQQGKQPAGKATPPAQTEAKAPAGPFLLVGTDRLTCVIRGITEKETPKKKKYLNVVFNGYHKTFNYGSCWDSALFEALRAGIGKECQLKIEMAKEDKFINIADVFYVDGVPYDLGKPSTPPPADAEPPYNDNEIPA